MTRLSPVPPRPQAAPLIPQDVPVYRITDEKGFFADDTLFPQGEIIAWSEEPNPFMEPLNDLAVKNYTDYLSKLDALGKQVAEKTGRSYTSYGDAYSNSSALAQQEGKRVQVIGATPEVPLMGAKKLGRPKVQKVVIGAAPEAAVPILGKGKFSLEKAGKNAVNKLDGIE